VALTLLALWDTGLLWCAFGYYGLKNLAPGLFRADSVAIHITPTFHALSQIANTASVGHFFVASIFYSHLLFSKFNIYLVYLINLLIFIFIIFLEI
jgi:hypothetical protein